MFWFAITHIFSAILELIHVGRLSDKEKDLEILILRHQLDVMTRLQAKPIKPNRAEKMTLAEPETQSGIEDLLDRRCNKVAIYCSMFSRVNIKLGSKHGES